MPSSSHARLIDRREFALQFLQLAAALAVPGRLFASPGRGPLDVIAQRDVMVAMRDGVQLATDVYLPARNGKPLAERVPVILERTPYGKSGKTLRHASEEIANIYASRGYAVVYQDCRGREKSEGEFVKYLSDGQDGYDSCAWIVKQPWCNGRIGTQGLSYAAHTRARWRAVRRGSLRCSSIPADSRTRTRAASGRAARSSSSRRRGRSTRRSRAPEIRDDPAKLAAMKAIDIKEWFRRMPWKRGNSPVTLAPEYENYLFEQWEHGDFDDYWKQLGIYAEGFYDQYIDAPMIHMSSWYDPYPRTATDNYVALIGASGVRCGSSWVPGRTATTHVRRRRGLRAGATIDGNVAPDFLTLRLRWFDRWLKGEKNGVDDEPAVRIFVMGGGTGRKNAAGRMDHGGRWRAEKEWPLPERGATPYYLRATVALSETAPSGESPPRDYDSTRGIRSRRSAGR